MSLTKPDGLGDPALWPGAHLLPDDGVDVFSQVGCVCGTRERVSGNGSGSAGPCRFLLETGVNARKRGTFGLLTCILSDAVLFAVRPRIEPGTSRGANHSVRDSFETGTKPRKNCVHEPASAPDCAEHASGEQPAAVRRGRRLNFVT